MKTEQGERMSENKKNRREKESYDIKMISEKMFVDYGYIGMSVDHVPHAVGE